jgi:DNA-binding transcriptional regulator PaaX
MLNKRQIENFKEFLDSGTTKSQITKIALITIAVGSVPFIVAGGSAIGNAVKIFKVFNKKERYKDRQIYHAFTNLKRNKFIEYVSDKSGVTTVRITRKGESKLKSFEIDTLEIKKPSKWDGKWRVVMFDLPIQYKKIRDSLRFKIKQIGFKQLQKSVWIYPYPCTDEILFIVDYYKVGKYIEIITADEILNDSKLRNEYDLK